MPYLIQKDTTLPRVIASGVDSDGNEYVETERAAYAAGQVVFEDDVAPQMRERLESGEEDHLSSLVKVISNDEARKLIAEQTGGGVVIPEHEAEAEVLAQDGKDVLTHQEVIEANINGDPEVVEEEAPDDSEGREAQDPESVRIVEVDEARRGDGEAPSGSSSEDLTVAELKEEAKSLGVEGYSNMKKDELVGAVDAAKSGSEEAPQ